MFLLSIILLKNHFLTNSISNEKGEKKYEDRFNHFLKISKRPFK